MRVNHAPSVGGRVREEEEGWGEAGQKRKTGIGQIYHHIRELKPIFTTQP